MPEVQTQELKRGLKDVYLDTTETCYIDGSIGKLIYRGYIIHDLAQKSTFEETIYLLLHGKLPTRNELGDFDAFLKAHRDLPPEVLETIRLVKNAHPMDVLRTALSATAAFDPDVEDHSREATIRKGLRLTSQAATAVAAHHQLRNGKEPAKPRKDLSHAANFMYMLHGKEIPPDEASVIDKDLILHAEHGSNASAFAARVTASTMSDLHAAVTAGVATLKGPLHGGAAQGVGHMVIEVGDESRAQEYVQGIISSGGRVMGFGHRVYKAEDPRARHMREECLRLGEKKGDPKWFRILSKVAEAMKPYEAKGIYQNVDFWSGAIYNLLDIPEDLFVPLFAMGRIPGWTVQVLEQQANNVLIRPRLQYVGPMDLEYVPIDQRG